MSRESLLRIAHIAGVVALVLGAVDPLEGSVVIAGGSFLLAISMTMTHDRHRKFFIASMIMILIGVSSMFFLTSKGGIGGNSGNPMWWALFMAPYPLGWLLAVILLIMRGIFKKRA